MRQASVNPQIFIDNRQRFIKKMQKNSSSKGAFIFGLISLFLLIAAGVGVYTLFNRERTRQLALIESQRQSFENLLTARDSAINEWVLTFNQIEEDLETIVKKENLLTVQSSDAEFTPDQKQQILDDIKHINTLLDLNKKKIAALNAELKKSGKSITGLQEKIADLEFGQRRNRNV